MWEENSPSRFKMSLLRRFLTQFTWTIHPTPSRNVLGFGLFWIYNTNTIFDIRFWHCLITHTLVIARIPRERASYVFGSVVMLLILVKVNNYILDPSSAVKFARFLSQGDWYLSHEPVTSTLVFEGVDAQIISQLF